MKVPDKKARRNGDAVETRRRRPTVYQRFQARGESPDIPERSDTAPPASSVPARNSPRLVLAYKCCYNSATAAIKREPVYVRFGDWALIQQRVDEAGTLVVEWDNNRLPKSIPMTMFYPIAFITLIAVTVWGTYCVATDEPDTPRIVVGLFSLALAVVIAIVMVLTWLMRYNMERVEISSTDYRHLITGYARLLSRKWPLADITSIEIGHHVDHDGRESLVTLSIWNGYKRDILGYWISDDLKHEIFEIITNHLQSRGYEFAVLDNFCREE